MANWSNPLLTSTYTNFLTEVKDRDTDVALQFNNAGTLGGGASNVPPGAIGWDATAKRWKTFSGGSWTNELADYYNLTAVGVTSATVPPNGIYLPSTNTVGISTNGTGKVYVTSGGNVGIGTANPQSIFHIEAPGNTVNQRIFTSDNVLNATASLTFGTTPGNRGKAAVVMTNINSGNASGALSLQTNDGSGLQTRLYITDTGDVNIKGAGTAGSTQAVSFSGSAPINSLVVQATTGNVGIGTANPSELLSIAGNVLISTGNKIKTDSSSGGFTIQGGATFPGGHIVLSGGNASDNIVFNRSGAGATSIETARIDSSGRLLVGTSSARSNYPANDTSAPLQVEGAGTLASFGLSITHGSSVGYPAQLVLNNHKSNTVGGVTATTNGFPTGLIRFKGSDGTSFITGAEIAGTADGNWSSGDCPGRLSFSTTAVGASSPTARATINNLGYLTGTVNGLSSGIYPAQQYYRLNAIYTGSNVNTAQSLFGVGVTLIGSTQYEFESVIYLYGVVSTTSTILSFKFGGTATINNILFMGSGPNTTGYDATPVSFVHTTAAGGDVTATMTPTISYYVCYIVKGTVSVNAGGTFIPQYQFSAAPGSGWNTGIGSYFSIWPLGASGSNISIGSWA